MAQFLTLTVLAIQVTYFVFCANILGIIPTPSYSHQVVFFDFWRDLSLRGHNVTVITTNPQRNDELTNLTEIDVSSSYKFFANISKEAEESMTSWNLHSWFHDLSLGIIESQLSHAKIQDLIHNRNNHFDVLLLEYYHPDYLALSEKYNCPIILISSMDAILNIQYVMGNTAHPSLYPNAGSPWFAPLNFRDRVTSAIYSMYTWYFYSFKIYPEKGLLMNRIFSTTTTMDELLRKVDMLFINVNPVVQPVRAIGPSTVNIGGIRKMTPQPLPEDLKDFLDSATNGFVYFSLGSNVKSKDLHEESLKSIVETLGELPCKVLWKFEADAIPNKPANVRLIKWAPQLGILAHPNIKAFVTQGGLQSMEEMIHNEVPCVVIPFFADQEQNARLMKSKGFATVVDRHPYIKKEELKKAILEILNNPKYKNAAKELKRLSLDTPMTGLERAIWWTEYVIRNKGAKHLRNPAADLPLYQYYLLDVIGFLLAVSVVILGVFFIVLKKIYSFLRTLLVKKSVATRKKLQ